MYTVGYCPLIGTYVRYRRRSQKYIYAGRASKMGWCWMERKWGLFGVFPVCVRWGRLRRAPLTCCRRARPARTISILCFLKFESKDFFFLNCFDVLRLLEYFWPKCKGVSRLAVVLVVHNFGGHCRWCVITGGLHCPGVYLCECGCVTVVHLECR